MRLYQLMICLLSGFLLAGCFTGNRPLQPSSEAVTPLAFEQGDIAIADMSLMPGEESLTKVFFANPFLDGREDPLVNPLPGVADVTVLVDSVEPLDEETLADNLVLQGNDQMPPEEPGEILAHEEPVFDFPVVENEKVRYFVDYFSGRAKKTFTLWLERSGRYLPMMQEIFAEQGLPRDLAYLAMVESGFNDKAYSWAHAVGPWQFIQSTGRRYGLKNDWWYDERRDPERPPAPQPVSCQTFMTILMATGIWLWPRTTPAPASSVMRSSVTRPGISGNCAVAST